MQSLKELLLLVPQVPNPNLTYEPGRTLSQGCINLPKLLSRSLGPVTGNLIFHLSQQVSSPYTLCSCWSTRSYSTDQFQVVRKEELQQGKWHPDQKQRHMKSQLCRAGNFIPQVNKRCLCHQTDPYSAKCFAIHLNTISISLNNIFKYFCSYNRIQA